MKKQIGVIASVLFLSAFALIWVGCSSANNRDCSPSYVCEQPCAPVCSDECAPACPKTCEPCEEACPARQCEPCKKAVPKCRYGNRNELKCHDFITVKARNPKMCMLGDQYPLCVDIEACDDVCDVVVTTTLPEGVSFMKSEPPAQVRGKKLVWEIGSMKKCEKITAKIWLKCECEGELCACFCATATPVRFCSLLCAKPRLECSKCGPKDVSLCDPVNYKVVVRNCGTCAAEDVVVTDHVPEGLEHSSGRKTLCYRLGTLCPGDEKVLNVCLKAVKRGRFCNNIVVTSCNANSVSCQACTNVSICRGCITKVGPKVMEMGKNAEYQITVSNTGDKALTQVCVSDCAPRATSIVSAPGATINGNQAVWKLQKLNPGEKMTFRITLTTCTPGCFTNRVSLTNCEGCNDCAEVTTRWKGRAALNVCVRDTNDPICVGDPVSYCINVTNQGTEPDNNVRVVVRFPREVTPISAVGDSAATVSGQTVTFAPFNNLNQRQTLKYRINARGKSAGDARVIVEVSSESIKTPIVQQESTIIQ